MEMGALLQSSASLLKGDLSGFLNYEEAYHQLISDIIFQQVYSTNLVLENTPVKRIFVDGGFSSNIIFMILLAEAFTGIEVYAVSVPQASALGAALAIHRHWNRQSVPATLVELKHFTDGVNSQA